MKEITVSEKELEYSESDRVKVINHQKYRELVLDERTKTISAKTVRQICLEAGACDAGFVEIGREALARERDYILRIYPRARSVISIIYAMNRENIQSPARYLYADEINRSDEEVSRVSRRIIRRLNEFGIRGVTLTGAFPMDMSLYPGKNWDVSHKTLAVEAGLGHMGINRLMINPKCGNFIVLSSILIDSELDQYDRPLSKNPCLDCGLCVGVCPVGAIHRHKPFDLMACMIHSYRDNALGFLDWIETMISSDDMNTYRKRFRDSETASLWQSLMYKLDYKCGYCMAVCPAGGDLESDYRDRRQSYIKELFKPLRNRAEPVYVVSGSEAELIVRRNPKKDVRHVKISLAKP